MDKEHAGNVTEEEADVFLKLTTVEYAICTPGFPQKRPRICRADDDDFLWDLFPFNSEYREHVFFIFYDEKMGKGVASFKWFCTKTIFRRLWQKAIEVRGGNPKSPEYKICLNDGEAVEDTRIQNDKQFRTLLRGMMAQYRNMEMDENLKKVLIEACNGVLEKADDPSASFGTAPRDKDRLDIAFCFFIADGLAEQLIKEHPFESRSSCIAKVKIIEWPSVKGEESGNFKENVYDEEGKYKSQDENKENYENNFENSMEFNRDRTDTIKESSRKYGDRSEMNDSKGRTGGDWHGR